MFIKKIKLAKFRFPKMINLLAVGVLLATAIWPTAQIFAQTFGSSGNYRYETWIQGVGLATNRIVKRNQTYSYYIQLKNNDSGSAQAVEMYVTNQNPAATTGPYVAADTYPSGVEARNYARQDCPDSEECFYWRFNPGIGQNQYRVATFTFTVADSAQDGSQLCFTAYASPHTPSHQLFEGNQLCLSVQGEAVAGGSVQNDAAIQRPFLTTSGGSLHAGADFNNEPCLLGGNASQVRGRSSATGSKADYVVSAGGSISNFGSGGQHNSNSLTFGNQLPHGSYGRVCRPDVAKTYLVDEPAPPLLINNFAVNYLADGIARYVGNVTITGGEVPRGRRATLVVQGNVSITGNITYAGSSYNDVADIPSLGIVATGRINIAPNVTNLYGVYYAGSTLAGSVGTIDTCQTGHGGYPASPNPRIGTGASGCNSPLVINGALIANRIYFRRTGGDADVSNSAAAETVNYIPTLMLRPPLGLGGVTNQF